MISLPTYQPPKAAIVRPTAKKVNALQPREQTITVSGYGEVVPIVYGEAEVAGPLIAGPVVRNSKLYYAIALSHGPIEDVVKAYVGEDEFAISDAFDSPKALTKGDYTYSCTFYRGDETQGVSPLLAAHITDFADTFSGIAYVVIEASGADAIFGGIHFKIKGRRVLDPRNSIVAYSENPALHLHDFITNERWGLGRGTIGIEALANECDKVLSYGPKTRVGHAILEPMEESSALELLAMYAEALFGFSGGDVHLVPDAEVPEGQITDIPANQIRAGTIRLSSQSSRNIPSSVTLNYNAKTVDGLAGAPAYISVAQTDASDPYMNSSLTLSGVYRQGEAERRAEQRLAQLRTPGRASFQMFDSGTYFSAGDVIRLPDMKGLAGEEFRLISQPEMIQAGLYQMHCEVYLDRNYAVDVVGTSIIPKDAVVFSVSDDQFDGFTQINSEPSLVRGWGQAGMEQAGEADIDVSGSAATSVDGGHKATNLPGLLVSGPRQGFQAGNPPHSIEVDRGAHSHTLNYEINRLGLGDFSHTSMVAHRSLADTLYAPIGAVFFRRDEIDTIGALKVIAKGLLSIANQYGENPGRGQADQRTSLSGEHIHWEKKLIPIEGFGASTMMGAQKSGNHRHSVTFEISAPGLSTVKVNAYRISSTSGAIPIGGIIGYLGTGAAPQGWAYCDGSSGTIDLTASFIGFDEDKQGGLTPSVSINSAEINPGGKHTHSGQTTYVGDLYPVNFNRVIADHPPEAGLHTHDIIWPNGNPFPITVTPRYTKMRFIQYVGE